MGLKDGRQQQAGGLEEGCKVGRRDVGREERRRTGENEGRQEINRKGRRGGIKL